MKEIAKKISAALRVVFGYGIMICLFIGGLTFLGYLAALIIGGETATAICVFIYKTLFPIVIKISNSIILLGLLVMYLNGEKALTASEDKKKREKYKANEKATD